MKHYDIIYSTCAHESIECLYNLYENIQKFHPGLYAAFIVHANPDLYAKKDEIPRAENLIWHPDPTVKERFTSKLFLGHLENFRYASTVCDFHFFSTLASNCMFVRPTDGEQIAKTPMLAPRATRRARHDPPRPNLHRHCHCVDASRVADLLR
mgnify:CR=1 FL=1